MLQIKPITKNKNGPRLTLGAFFVPKHEIIRKKNMVAFTRSEIEQLEKIEIICQRKISKIKKVYSGSLIDLRYDYETLSEIINGLNYFIGEFENENK